jgi:hypothetical protein
LGAAHRQLCTSTSLASSSHAYPGLTAPMIEWIADSFHQFVRQISSVSTMAVR